LKFGGISRQTRFDEVDVTTKGNACFSPVNVSYEACLWIDLFDVLDILHTLGNQKVKVKDAAEPQGRRGLHQAAIAVG